VPDLGTGELVFPTSTSSGDDGGGEEWAEPSDGSFAVVLPERPSPETLLQQQELVAAAALTSTSICPMLPKTKSQSQSFVIQVGGGGRGEKDLVLATPEGEVMLTLDSSNQQPSVRRRSSCSSEVAIPKGSGHHNHHDTRLKEKSYIRDAQGQLTAVIVKTVDDSKTHRYKVGSPHPAYPGQRRTSGTNLFTWAEVKNANKSALGLQYSMRVKTGPSSGVVAWNDTSAELANSSNNNTKTEGSPPPSSVKFVSEHFGPSLFKWDTPKGILIRRESSSSTSGSSSSSVHVPGQVDQSGADSEQSAQMVYTRDARGLVVGPKVDPCLMFCFVTIMEEMIEKRQR
jgi:hypothetical protein